MIQNPTRAATAAYMLHASYRHRRVLLDPANAGVARQRLERA